MNINLGKYEFYIGTDYVIRPERRLFRRFDKTITVSGAVNIEGITFGFLLIISYQTQLIDKGAIKNDTENIASYGQ